MAWRSRYPIFWIVFPLVALWAIFDTYWRLAVPPLTADEYLYPPTGWRYLHWTEHVPNVNVLGNFEHPPLAKWLFGLAEELAGHPSYVAARAVAATCTLLAGLGLGLWLAHAGGRWVGLLGGSAVVLVPTLITPQLTSFGRDAMLDPVAEVFMVGAVALTWFWFQSAGWRGWLLALGVGALTGLATASKENGFLGTVGPVLLGLALCARRPRMLLMRALQAVAALLLAGIVFVGCYLPLGHPSAHISYLLRFQLHQRDIGHPVGFAGQVSRHPPWWLNFWYAGHYLGAVISVVLCGTALAAIVLRHDRIVGWCVAAITGPVLFHCFIAGNALLFYWVMWMPAVFALSALGTVELASRARQSGPALVRVGCAVLAATALALMTVSAVRETARVAGAPREGASVLPRLRATLHLHGTVLGTGIYGGETVPYLQNSPLLQTIPADLDRIDTIVVGQPRCRTPAAPSIRALVAANLAAGTLREAHADRLLHIYVVTGTLRAPTRAEIAAQPRFPLADHC